MKNLKSIFAALLLFVALPMSAQFSNVSMSGSSSIGDAPKSYNRFSVGYLNTSTSGNGGKLIGGDNFSMNGFGIQFNCGKLISTTSPVYFDCGARLT